VKTATKVSAYGLILAVVFGGAWVAGSTAGPLDATASPSDAGHSDSAGHDTPSQAGSTDQLPGLASAANGHRLDLTSATGGELQFRIIGANETPVTAFDVEHDKRLHLVVVRRDGSGYRHLHPEMAADGTWRTALPLPTAGSYRLFTDFKPTGGEKTVLGQDIQIPGQYQPVTFSPTRTSTVDGYEVRLDGELEAGKSSDVTATVLKNGRPVADLQPYLAAYGHLVALRSTDLGYLHVHPLGVPGDGRTAAGPRVRFAVEVPTADRYRLFFDFQHEGEVRTAEFTVDAHSHAG
jgi:hypothetical protein